MISLYFQFMVTCVCVCVSLFYDIMVRVNVESFFFFLRSLYSKIKSWEFAVLWKVWIFDWSKVWELLREAFKEDSPSCLWKWSLFPSHQHQKVSTLHTVSTCCIQLVLVCSRYIFAFVTSEFWWNLLEETTQNKSIKIKIESLKLPSFLGPERERRAQCQAFLQISQTPRAPEKWSGSVITDPGQTLCPDIIVNNWASKVSRTPRRVY